ncbi:aldo/keto reductase [Dactylosporangium sp. CA-233914]|uniref:aldo/keto reductase n=1 Tax=Dactylosporangium sp. CA-233914 TaxID=3239934 RepID=UPI003D8A352E
MAPSRSSRSPLATIVRGPLAMGLLGGRYTAQSELPRDDVRDLSPQWSAYFRDGRSTPEFLTRIESIREILTSGAQGAPAWLWAYDSRTIPIRGCRTVAQVEGNAGAPARLRRTSRPRSRG